VGQIAVLVEEGLPRGGLYELEQTTTYSVVDSESNEVLMVFQGQMEARLSTSTGMWEEPLHSGVCQVIVADDGQSVTVRYHDGREESKPLPERPGRQQSRLGDEQDPGPGEEKPRGQSPPSSLGTGG